MLSLNQANGLRMFLQNGDTRRALESFVTEQRIYCMQQTVSNLRSLNDAAAKKFAVMDEVYSDLLAQLERFVEKSEQV